MAFSVSVIMTAAIEIHVSVDISDATSIERTHLMAINAAKDALKQDHSRSLTIIGTPTVKSVIISGVL
jgi:hypothetical protein